MGKLIIDGNSFFEIDEECLKKKHVSKKCGLDKYFHMKDKQEEIIKHERNTRSDYRNKRQ